MIATYEGPCAGLQIQALIQEVYADPQSVSGGVFAKEVWRSTPRLIACDPSKQYRITVEVAP
jgi:hypothetical protein